MRYLYLIFFLYSISVSSQVKIGDNASLVDSSAMLEVESTDRGFLLPRLSTSQMNLISNPSEGLVIYNITDKKLFLYTGDSWIGVRNENN